MLSEVKIRQLQVSVELVKHINELKFGQKVTMKFHMKIGECFYQRLLMREKSMFKFNVPCYPNYPGHTAASVRFF